LLSGEVDCAFTNNKSNLDNFDLIQLTQDQLLCIVSKQSPLYHETAISVKQIENEPFIMPISQCYDDVKLFFDQYKV
ncbi:LysR family transcriptional regulator substrate-binding protein, partial [Aeromonas dhakensis]|uniref:LysR family transcriptional regulator substrate-binding protein n=1 Tax=Aeromonas dhakensis TaxID=196024 RepID=UPI0038B50AF4